MCYFFFPLSRMISLPFQICGQPGNKSEKTDCEVWRLKRIKSGLELKWNHLCANWEIQMAVQPWASGSWIPEWWQSVLTSNFCHGFCSSQPRWPSTDTLSPQATADSPDKASTLTRLQLLYQVSELFMLWRMFLCLFEKLWASGLQRRGKKTLPGLENRAITMLSQCFLPLFSLTSTAQCNLTLWLF